MAIRFSSSLSELQRQIELLQSSADALATGSQNTLSTAFAELQFAIQELEQQSQELMATRQLVEAERTRFWRLFHFAPEAYLVTDGAGNTQAANQIAEALLATPPGYLIGQPIANLLPQGDRQAFQARLNGLSQNGQGRDWEFNLLKHNGVAIDVLASVTTLSEAGSSSPSLLWLIRDNTERKQAQAALQRAEERFRALVENSHDIFVLLDAKGVIRYRGPSANYILGYAPEAVVGRSIFDLVHPEDLDTVQDAFRRTLEQTETLVRVELRREHYPFLTGLSSRYGNHWGGGCLSRRLPDWIGHFPLW